MLENDRKFLAAWTISNMILFFLLYISNIVSAPLYIALMSLPIFQNQLWAYLFFYADYALFIALVIFALPSVQAYVQDIYYQASVRVWWRLSFLAALVASFIVWLAVAVFSQAIVDSLARYFSEYRYPYMLINDTAIIALGSLLFWIIFTSIQSLAFPEPSDRINWLKVNILGCAALFAFVIAYCVFMARFVINTFGVPVYFVFLSFGLIVFYSYTSYLEAVVMLRYFNRANLPRRNPRYSPENPRGSIEPAEKPS